MLDRRQIEAILPHRSPFLFVHRVTAIDEGARIVGELDVRADLLYLSREREPHQLPATILAETMAQVGAILALHPEENRGRTIYFRAIEDAEFLKPVVVGATVQIEAHVKKMRSRFGSLTVSAKVAGEVVARGVMSFALG